MARTCTVRNLCFAFVYRNITSVRKAATGFRGESAVKFRFIYFRVKTFEQHLLWIDYKSGFTFIYARRVMAGFKRYLI